MQTHEIIWTPPIMTASVIGRFMYLKGEGVDELTEPLHRQIPCHEFIFALLPLFHFDLIR
jgi:hypothetical protein